MGFNNQLGFYDRAHIMMMMGILGNLGLIDKITFGNIQSRTWFRRQGL